MFTIQLVQINYIYNTEIFATELPRFSTAESALVASYEHA